MATLLQSPLQTDRLNLAHTKNEHTPIPTFQLRTAGNFSEAPSTMISDQLMRILVNIGIFTDILQSKHLRLCFVNMQKWTWVL